MTFSGWRPDDSAAKLLVGDVDSRPDPPEDAQSPAGRDDASQRSKVWALVARASRGSLHVRHLPRTDQQIDGPQVR